MAGDQPVMLELPVLLNGMSIKIVSGLGCSDDGEALVKDDQETCCPFCGKALFLLQLFDAYMVQRTTALPLPRIMHDQS